MLFTMLLPLLITANSISIENIEENSKSQKSIDYDSSIEYRHNNLATKDSLRKIQRNSFFVGIFSPCAILSVNYENTVRCFRRFYLTPQIGFGIPYHGYIWDINTSFHAYLNGNIRLFSPLFIDLGGGFSTNLDYNYGKPFLFQAGLKYIGSKGVYTKLTYNIEIFYSTKYNYVRWVSWDNWSQIGFYFGYSF